MAVGSAEREQTISSRISCARSSRPFCPTVGSVLSSPRNVPSPGAANEQTR